MRGFIFALVGIAISSAAVAADVAARQSCADIKGRIDALAAQGDLNDSDAALLTDLRAAYRRDCVARASGRGSRTIAATRTQIAAPQTPAQNTDAVAVAPQEPLVADPCDNPDANGCCPGEEYADIGNGVMYCCKGDACFPPMPVTPSVPEKSEEEIAAEIAANIEKGLCSDGTKPNKFGCCAGEIFKDLGNATFACCKKDGEECFPPMQ